MSDGDVVAKSDKYSKNCITKDEDRGIEDIEHVPNMNEIHSKLPNEAIPNIGMEFASEDMAYDFYRKYSRVIGFGIRLSKFHRDQNSNFLLDRIIFCSYEGAREKDKRAPYVKKHRALTRVGCNAMIKISSRISGRFRIIKFEPQHNHVLSTPSKTFLLRSQKMIRYYLTWHVAPVLLRKQVWN